MWVKNPYAAGEAPAMVGAFSCAASGTCVNLYLVGTPKLVSK